MKFGDVTRTACEYAKLSQMEVCIRRDEQHRLDSIGIYLSGKCAAIPPMKNSRQILPIKARSGGTRVFSRINPEHRARIGALDILWSQKKPADGRRHLPWDFGAEPVHVLLICGYQPRRFDPIGCLETVLDWLEPSIKTTSRGLRGWGIGVIQNDCVATGYAVRAGDVGPDTPDTRIMIRRSDLVRQHEADFIARGFYL